MYLVKVFSSGCVYFVLALREPGIFLYVDEMLSSLDGRF